MTTPNVYAHLDPDGRIVWPIYVQDRETGKYSYSGKDSYMCPAYADRDDVRKRVMRTLGIWQVISVRRINMNTRPGYNAANPTLADVAWGVIPFRKVTYK
jgi:hypothetical protein